MEPEYVPGACRVLKQQTLSTRRWSYRCGTARAASARKGDLALILTVLIWVLCQTGRGESSEPSSCVCGLSGFTVEPYAVVSRPARIAFDPSGDLYVGQDGPGLDCLHIRRVTEVAGRGSVKDYGDCVVDPDAVTYDRAGLICGEPGIVVGGGINASVGTLSCILNDEQTQTALGPLAILENPSDMAWDANECLLIAMDFDSAVQGNVVVTCDGDNLRELFPQRINARVWSIALDAEGRIFTGASDGIIRVHDREGNAVNLSLLRNMGGGPPLAFAPENSAWGDYLYTIDKSTGRLLRVEILEEDGRVVAGTEEVIGLGFTGWATDLEFGPDGGLYASLWKDSRIYRVGATGATQEIHDLMDSELAHDIEIFGMGKLCTADLSGVVSVRRTAPYSDAKTGLRTVDTEIVRLELNGDDPGCGPIRIGLQPHRRSAGKVVAQERGICFPAESYFDVYIEIDVPDLGLTLINCEPATMRCTVGCLPPIDCVYQIGLSGGNFDVALFPAGTQCGGQEDAVGQINAADHTPTESIYTGPPRQLPGDCNQDGDLDISDAVCIFGVLFLGVPAAFPCGDGSARDPANISQFDWQPDGNLDISDGISLLKNLFLDAPPHPLAVPGMETTMCVGIAGCPDNRNCSP